MLVLVG